MTPRLAGGIAVAMLAVGILTGAAGTIVVRDATSPEAGLVAVMANHMAGVTTGSMMSGSMMGPGAMMGSGAMMGPGLSFGPGMMPAGPHDQHHPASTPDGAK
jgi:hypothetical protein